MNKRSTRTRNRGRTAARAVIGALAAASFAVVAVPGSAKPSLDLPDLPLVGGKNVDPNVLVAFDDSGSMTNELLMDNKGGALFWHGRKGFFDSDGAFFKTRPNFDSKFSNVFPRNSHFENSEGTVPPLPQFAFARSPSFNKGYFKPTVEYKPWPDYKDASQLNGGTTSIPYNPKQPTGASIDLTQVIKKTGGKYEFQIKPGMTIRADTSYYHCYNGCSFHVHGSDFTVNQSKDYAIAYFPATFYIRADSPSDARTKAGADFSSYDEDKIKAVQSEWPKHTDKITLYRFQIKSDNFDTNADYDAAIHNFANWFTYHRTRALATKGALVRAFNQFDNLRVDACTINNRKSLYPEKLSDNRESFNEKILGFNVGGGTPDATALKHLGSQFEDNRGKTKDIIQSPCQKNYAILFTDGYNKSTVNVGGDKDGDGHSNTMGDIGTRFYDDLDVPNSKLAEGKVRVKPACSQADHDPSLDCNKNLHVTMFGVTLGQSGKIFGTSNQPDDPYNDSVDWPPRSTTPDKNQIDDLWHATVNSYGELLNAARPDLLVEKFKAVLQTVINSQLSSSSLATTRSTFSSDTLGYRGTFKGRYGSFKAYTLSKAGSSVATGAVASAADRNFSAANNDPAGRSIFTSLPGDGSLSGKLTDASAFKASDIGTSLLGKYDLSATKIAFLRGAHDGEKINGGDLRNRNGHVLGPVVNSSPAYVGAKAEFTGYIGRPNFQPYSTFRNNTDRTPMVYVETNDGMLHAFDASTLEEKFAYVPGSILPKLHTLTDPNGAQQFYADGSPVVGDAYFSGSWHSVLVAGLRGGGNSIFALDVTDPDSFDKSDILWEDSTNRFPELGKTFGKPSIVKLNNGKWAALFGNGYNSANNKAVFYAVNLETGKKIEKIELNASGVTRTGPNGLSAPEPVDVDGDLRADYVFAGDLHGNLWRIDLPGHGNTAWNAQRVFTTPAYGGDNAKPRPITAPPIVSLHPKGSEYGVMVYFGTGKFLEKDDAELHSNQKNYVYGVWEPHVFTNTTSTPAKYADPVSTGDLAKQSLAAESGNYAAATQNTVNYARGTVDADNNDYRGWQLDLGANGQLAVNQPYLQGSVVNFSTTVPSDKVCEAGGSGYYYQVDAASGGRTAFISFDLSGDGGFSDSDKVVTLKDGTKVGASRVKLAGLPSRAVHMAGGKAGTDVALIEQAGGATGAAAPGGDDSSTDGGPDGGPDNAIRTQTELNPGGRINWREIRR